MALTLAPEVRKRALASIRRYCSENLELEAGDLKAGALLDFFLKEIGPSVRNAAIADAQVFFRDRVADLEGMGEAEFAYLPKGPAHRPK